MSPVATNTESWLKPAQVTESLCPKGGREQKVLEGTWLLARPAPSRGCPRAPHLCTRTAAPRRSGATRRLCRPPRPSPPACWSWGRGSRRRQKLQGRAQGQGGAAGQAGGAPPRLLPLREARRRPAAPRQPPLTRVQREGDLAVVLRLHAIRAPTLLFIVIVLLRLPRRAVGLLVLEVHVLHLVSQVICGDRGGSVHGTGRHSREPAWGITWGWGLGGAERDWGGPARDRGGPVRACGRPSGPGGGLSGPGGPGARPVPLSSMPRGGVGARAPLPASPGPGGPSSSTSMISSSPWKPSAPGPSAGSMPAAPRFRFRFLPPPRHFLLVPRGALWEL